MPEPAPTLAPHLELRPEGLYAPDFEAFLDPAVPVPRAILSHAHADHAVDGHGEIWATPETLAFYRRRHPAWTGRERGIAFGEGIEARGTRLTLISSGHILGAAQALFASETGSLLYTGDFKRRASRTAQPAESVRASTLVTETTFGLPVFRFPPREELERRILAACREAIDEGETPVLLAYALGKAQEVAAILAEAGIPTVLHGAAWKLVPDFAAAGVALPGARAYESGPPGPGEALIAPPSTSRTAMVRGLKKRRVIYLSGWAMRSASRADLDADVLISMSDHADFEDLLAHVRDVAPASVLAHHGFAGEFARILSGRGIPAAALPGREERPREDA
ncbi:MAG: DNA ligase-associated DEXH box helicase [Thermoanaerobaculia bacterium]